MVVTFNRQPIFAKESFIRLLESCLNEVRENLPYMTDAMVILPDHLHTIWTLPDDDSDFSTRWNLVKGAFSRRYSGFRVSDVPESMLKKNEAGIWQRRFWEHVIYNQEDFNRHCDYIHYNPVKHGLVKSPAEWKHSSINDFIDAGKYSEGWGEDLPKGLSELNYE